MEERREIQHWQDVADPAAWTFEDEHGHELFRRGQGESPQEMEAAGYRAGRTGLRMRSGSLRSTRRVGDDRSMPSDPREASLALVVHAHRSLHGREPPAMPQLENGLQRWCVAVHAPEHRQPCARARGSRRA
jgi:hypothetical protein